MGHVLLGGQGAVAHVLFGGRGGVGRVLLGGDGAVGHVQGGVFQLCAGFGGDDEGAWGSWINDCKRYV